MINLKNKDTIFINKPKFLMTTTVIKKINFRIKIKL